MPFVFSLLTLFVFPEEFFFCDLPGIIRLLPGKGIVFIVGVVVVSFHGLLLMLAKCDRKQGDEGPDSSCYAYPHKDEGQLSGMDKKHYEPYKDSEEKHAAEGLYKPFFALCRLPAA